MSRTSRLQRSILAAKKQREKKPRPVAKTLDRIGVGKLNQHARENLDVLHAIESALVRCFLDDHRVDDAVVFSTLRSVILEDPPAAMPQAWVFSELVAARATLTDLAEEVWNECLRVVMDSVRYHSTLDQGDISYLEFVSPMIVPGID